MGFESDRGDRFNGMSRFVWGIVVGNEAEFACLPKSALDIRARVCPWPVGPVAAARQLVAAGVDGLISCGLTQGLAKDLVAGSVILADSVLTPGGDRVKVDEKLFRYLRGGLSQLGLVIHIGPIATESDNFETLGDVEALYKATRAPVCDGISHIVASVADEVGLPFAILRVVANPAGKMVPRSVREVRRIEGSIPASKLLGAVAKWPRNIGNTLVHQSEMRQAYETLRKTTRVFLPKED